MSSNPITMLIEGNGSLAGRDRAGAFSAIGSGALRYAPAPGARVNYCPNPLTGPSVVGLVPAGVSLSASTEWVGSGTHSCKVVVTAVAVSSGLFTTSSPLLIRAPSGATVTTSFRVFNPQLSPRKIRTLIRAFDLTGSSKGDIVTYTSFVLGANSDTTITQTGVVPSGASGLYVVIYTDNTDPTNPFQNGDVLYVTDLRVNPGASDLGPITNPIWLDPATGQLGTANASPSVSRAQFWVEEATTNLIINPSFDTNTTSWNTYSDRTLTRDTTVAYIGSASCKVTSALLIGADAFAMKYSPGITAAGAGSYTWSAWVFVPTTWTGGSICLDVRDFVGGTGAGLKAYANMSTKGVWQRVTNTFTVVGGDLTGNLYVGVDTQWKASEFFYITNIQLEAKAYATSFADGSLGTGYTWAGTAHASESTRAMASIVMPQTADRISPVSGALAARFQRGSASVGDKRIIRIGLESAGFDAVYLFIKSSTLDVYERWVKDGVTGTEAVVGSIVANVRQIAYIDWLLSSTTLNSELSGGGLVTLYPQMAGDFNNASGFIAVGSLHTSAQSLNGLIGPVAIYDRPLTDAERLMVNNAIDSDGNLWTVLGGSNILIPLTARRRQH